MEQLNVLAILFALFAIANHSSPKMRTLFICLSLLAMIVLALDPYISR